MGKGRLLTESEVYNSKNGQVVWFEPNDKDKEFETGMYSFNKRGGVFKSENDDFQVDSTVFNRGKFYEYIKEPHTYKTSEMMAMLEENPKLKFESYVYKFGEKTNRKSVAYVGEYNGIFISENGNKTTHVFKTNDEWTLIEEPKEVTFLEAVEAKKEFKTVKCVLGGDETIYKNDTSWFADQEQRAVSHMEILNGKWFVIEND